MHTNKGVIEHLKECVVILNDDGSVITSAEVVKLLDDDWHGVKVDYRFPQAPYAPHIFFAMTTSSGLRPGNVLQEGLEALEAYIQKFEPWLYEWEENPGESVAWFQAFTRKDLIATDAHVLTPEIEVDLDFEYLHELLLLEDVQLDELDRPMKMFYVGTVQCLLPSGKYYTPFARSNVTDFEAEVDQIWWEKAEEAALKQECYLTNGEGSATDIFLIKYVQDDDEDDEDDEGVFE